MMGMPGDKYFLGHCPPGVGDKNPQKNYLKEQKKRIGTMRRNSLAKNTDNAPA